MNQFMIVGGGISGLIAAHILKDLGVDFAGLEPSGDLAMHFPLSTVNVFQEQTLDALSSILSEQAWVRDDVAPSFRAKGNWVPAGPTDNPESENYWLHSPRWAMAADNLESIRSLSTIIAPSFHCHKKVAKLDIAGKTIHCTDESTFSYEKIVWCLPLQELALVSGNQLAAIAKPLRTLAKPESGFMLEFKCRRFDAPSSLIVFKFRFKSNHLEAIATISPADDQGILVQWMVWLPESISESHEEVAKCVKSFRRELAKEFDFFSESHEASRFIFIPAITGASAITHETLHLFNDLIYFGPEIHLPSSTSQARYLDRLAANVPFLRETLRTESISNTL